jgi:type II secretory pathway component PulC
MYRILTEEKNVEQVKATLTGLGLDFTLFNAQGCWRGQRENSLAIELDNISLSRAEDAARIIKSMNKQEAILLQEIPVVSKLI